MKNSKPEILLLDDEEMVLNGLKRMLKIHGHQALMATDPKEAFKIMGSQKIDILICDQRMPEMSGLDVMRQVKIQYPDIVRILLTGFADLNSTIAAINDGLIFRYLTKPWTDHDIVNAIEDAVKYQKEQTEKEYIINNYRLEREKWEKTLEELGQAGKDRRKNNFSGQKDKKLGIDCLGSFKMVWEDGQPIKWRTEKTREIFVYLLAKEGRYLPKEVLLDELWPEEDYDKALRQLYNGIYYIRKALADNQIDRSMICVDSKYNLMLGNAVYDVRKFYDLEKAGDLASLEEMDACYRGDYLETEDYPWAYAEREKLRNLYFQSMIKLSGLYIERKDFYKAENILIKVYKKDPYEELITEHLLDLYRQTGQKNKALLHYADYTKLLLEDLNIKPGKKVYQLLTLAKE